MSAEAGRQIAAREIAALTGGRLIGSGDVTVGGVAPLDRAGPGDLSFLASPRYLPYFQRTSASVALVKPDFAAAEGGPATRIVVPDPHAALLVVLVIDPWAVFYSGRENSNDEAELALAELRRLQLTHGLTVVVLHHFGKSESARDPEDLWRGASRLADWASTRVTLLPFYSAAQAKKIGLSRQQARQ